MLCLSMSKPQLRLPCGITRISPPTAPRKWSPSRVSEIIPGLYVTDLEGAENVEVLQSLGITHVVSVMRGIVKIPPALHRAQIPVDDTPWSNLVEYLPASTQFIRDALQNPNSRVLVHCAQGESRSPSVVCAYLIAQRGYTSEEAIKFVKARRETANPNVGFVGQLQEYASVIRGQK